MASMGKMLVERNAMCLEIKIVFVFEGGGDITIYKYIILEGPLDPYLYPKMAQYKALEPGSILTSHFPAPASSQ